MRVDEYVDVSGGDWVIEILHTDSEADYCQNGPVWVPVGHYHFDFEKAVDIVGLVVDARVPGDKVRIRNVRTDESLLVGCIL